MGKEKGKNVQSGIDEKLLRILKSFIQSSRQITLYKGDPKYNIFLFPQKFQKYFINKAAALGVLVKEDSNKNNKHTSTIFGYFSQALFVTGLLVFSLGLLFNSRINNNRIVPQVAGVREYKESDSAPHQKEEVSEDNFSSAEKQTFKDIFEIDSIEQLNAFDVKTYAVESGEDREVINKKKELLRRADMVDQYLDIHKSDERYDRSYDVPVKGAVYIQVAQQYEVPLKYLIAVAQKESLFGSNRFTLDGYVTNIGKSKNIIPVQLSESQDNIAFDTWIESLEFFGVWYQSQQMTESDNCTNWQTYNPSESYCEEIEKIANQFEDFLNQR